MVEPETGLEPTRLELLAAAFEREGFTTRLWEGTHGTRLYLRKDGRDFGFLVESDDGGTGTCKGVSKPGMVAAIVRKALAEK